jgi:hypothetical protein
MKYILHGFIPKWLEKVVDGITYKPGWVLYITARNDELTRREPWAYTIYAQCTVEDIVSKAPIQLHGPGITVYQDYMDERTVVHLIFSAIRALECHEMEEQFNYNGIRIFDPHRTDPDKERLFELAATHPEFEPQAMRLLIPSEI